MMANIMRYFRRYSEKLRKLFEKHQWRRSSFKVVKNRVKQGTSRVVIYDMRS